MAPFIDIEGLMGRSQESFYLRSKVRKRWIGEPMWNIIFQKSTHTFYDQNDMKMLERRKKQAEIDETMRVGR